MPAVGHIPKTLTSGIFLSSLLIAILQLPARCGHHNAILNVPGSIEDNVSMSTRILEKIDRLGSPLT
jgi:hypothetical protein